MPAARPLRVVRPEPPALHGRAAADLQFIRQTMENAGTFTAVSGKGGIGMGAAGCAAAVVASMQHTPGAWLLAWLGGAAVAIVVGLVSTLWKAGVAGTPILRGVGAKYVRGLCPPLVAGALLTVVLWRAGLAEALPGTWLLLYGVGLMAAGAFSIAVVPVMGACFMAFGAAALVTPAAWGDLWMACGFGGLHMAFGTVIWRRHGG